MLEKSNSGNGPQGVIKQGDKSPVQRVRRNRGGESEIIMYQAMCMDDYYLILGQLIPALAQLWPAGDVPDVSFANMTAAANLASSRKFIQDIGLFDNAEGQRDPGHGMFGPRKVDQ